MSSYHPNGNPDLIDSQVVNLRILETMESVLKELRITNRYYEIITETKITLDEVEE